MTDTPTPTPPADPLAAIAAQIDKARADTHTERTKVHAALVAKRRQRDALNAEIAALLEREQALMQIERRLTGRQARPAETQTKAAAP